MNPPLKQVIKRNSLFWLYLFFHAKQNENTYSWFRIAKSHIKTICTITAIQAYIPYKELRVNMTRDYVASFIKSKCNWQ